MIQMLINENPIGYIISYGPLRIISKNDSFIRINTSVQTSRKIAKFHNDIPIVTVLGSLVQCDRKDGKYT